MSNTPFTLPDWLSPAHLTTIKRGIEKEGLRMAHSGYSATTPHPTNLGSKLTHPFITTDYSENLLELITPPYASIDDALAMLKKLHIVVAQNLGDELMWPLSMPCMLSDKDTDIPLADYGTSNLGKLKTLYRSGLAVRYGRKMQTIAGIHYNLSLGDNLFQAWQHNISPNTAEQHSVGLSGDLQAFKNDKYLGLIRNFKRLSPLLLYLTGASPSICPCFVDGRKHNLNPLSDKNTTLYRPYATSLRMGKLGYTNSVQENLGIFYNHLDDYIAELKRAVNTPFSAFNAIGVDDSNGIPIQINDHILQIENEYYSPIRPKQLTHSGQTPTDALKDRGILYVEFRAIDLNPYSEIGIDQHTACFLEILAIYCLLLSSPPLYEDEERLLSNNIETIVNDGRKNGITIDTLTGSIAFATWANKHLTAMTTIAELFDKNNNHKPYQTALQTMLARLADSEKTPSARIIADSLKLGSTWQLGASLGQAYKQSLLTEGLNTKDQHYFDTLATTSWQEQKTLEASDTLSFKEYLAPYRS